MQALRRSQNGIPLFRSACDRQVDGLPFLLRQGQGAGEQNLFFRAEELLRFKLVLTAFASAEKAQMQGDYILLAGVDKVENSAKIVERGSMLN